MAEWLLQCTVNTYFRGSIPFGTLSSSIFENEYLNIKRSLKYNKMNNSPDKYFKLCLINISMVK